MSLFQQINQPCPLATDLNCGIPADSQYFDDSSISISPDLNQTVTLAQFELPAQYCGVLEHFSQFTDVQSSKHSEIETPGFRWQIRANKQPLFPYHDFSLVLNPWGYNSFPINIRLPQATELELVISRVAVGGSKGQKIKLVGGRLQGRFWYNQAFGRSGEAA
jgi:hypothetical protein